MAADFLNIIGELVPVVPIVRNEAFLFRLLSYVMYGTQVLARELRKIIVKHMLENWEEFSIMSHDNEGNNYTSTVQYLAHMS